MWVLVKYRWQVLAVFSREGMNRFSKRLTPFSVRNALNFIVVWSLRIEKDGRIGRN